jgi:hypothetical protein
MVSSRSSFSFSLGKSFQFLDERVAFAALEQDGDNGQVSVLVGVNQVHYHVVSFAVDSLFAGPVKMELFQRVLLVAHADVNGDWWCPVVSGLAGGKFRFQIAPVVGTLVSVVAPVAGFMLLGGRKRGR